MAASKQQFTYCSTDITELLQLRAVPDRAMVSVNRDVSGNPRMYLRIENDILCNRLVSKTSTRNAIIALIIMLTLLLPVQAPACCGDPDTPGLTTAAATDNKPHPAQAPSAAVNEPSAVPVPTTTKAESISQQMAFPAALALAAATPAQAPGQSATSANEDIKTNTATTLTAITAAGFVKIANSGQPLDAKADKWECVEDKSSRLTWEVKKNDGGIRDKDYTYTWLRNNIGENKGVSDGGRCKGGVKCDTYNYVRAMNVQKLCGYSDWRLPTREEMETLVDYNNTAKEATIDKTYFPEAVPSWYWTATENPHSENFAWYVLFRNGIALNDLKERPKHIRLVRGNQTQQ
jgi:hypothetical protein